jgi:hypothetical protein
LLLVAAAAVEMPMVAPVVVVAQVVYFKVMLALLLALRIL